MYNFQPHTRESLIIDHSFEYVTLKLNLRSIGLDTHHISLSIKDLFNHNKHWRSKLKEGSVIKSRGVEEDDFVTDFK